MDLQTFIDSPAHVEGTERVARMLTEEDIRYVYVQFVSATGRVNGKGVPAAHWRNVARSGIQMVYGATANVAADRNGRYLGYPPDAHELVAIPEPASFARLPWDPRVARVFARLFHPLDAADSAGRPLTSDCRGNLLAQQDAFAAAHGGLHLRVGTEPEMMWLKRDGSGELCGASAANCYHIDQFEVLRDPMLRVIEYCQALGLDMIQGDHEDAPGQLELNFSYDIPSRNADRLITYRQVCRQVAREFGLVACFMPKPFTGVAGSGCHHNVSLWTGGADAVLDTCPAPAGLGANNLYRRGGVNELENGLRQGSLTSLQRYAIGGVLRHAQALTAVAASTVNSYRRLLDAGFWTAESASWGVQNRTCAVRVSAAGRLEYRMADSLVNPYLMASGLIAAISDGISNEIDPGRPLSGTEKNEDRTDFGPLPNDLMSALTALDNDSVIKGSMTGDMYRVFRELKLAEWDEFMSTVSPWDFDRYLESIP